MSTIAALKADGTRAAPLRVLMVEDDANDAELLQAHLAQAKLDGAQVLHARTLTEGLALVQSHDVQITLLDLDLPDSQGLHTLERMRAAGAGIPAFYTPTGVGTVVAEGDVIARLDPNVARMDNDSAQANVARLAAQVRYDRAHAQRLQELHDRKVVSKAAVDQANSTRDANEAALKQAEASAKRSKFRLDRSEIRAPFAGRVVSRLINAGEYASPGKEIVRHDVTILGRLNLAADLAADASRMYSRNMEKVIEHFLRDGFLRFDFRDEITRRCVVTHDGEIVDEELRRALGAVSGGRP